MPELDSSNAQSHKKMHEQAYHSESTGHSGEHFRFSQGYFLDSNDANLCPDKSIPSVLRAKRLQD